MKGFVKIIALVGVVVLGWKVVSYVCLIQMGKAMKQCVDSLSLNSKINDKTSEDEKDLVAYQLYSCIKNEVDAVSWFVSGSKLRKIDIGNSSFTIKDR